MDGLTLNDGHSNSTWQFGYTSQLRATLEKTISGGVSLGAAAGFSNPKLSYIGRNIGDPCGPGCQADADVTQYMAFIRGGGGVGFHGLFNLEAGVTQFSKFRDRATGNVAGVLEQRFHLRTRRRVRLRDVDEHGPLHQRADGIWCSIRRGMSLELSRRSAPRVSVFRVGGRVGF